MSKFRESLRFSFQRSIPILIGFFPLGVAYGILMAQAGYNFVWTGFTSMIVYAGSLQYLMVDFLTSDMSMSAIVLAAILLNSRHLFYGLSFIEKFRQFGAWKYLMIFGMSDESYSLQCAYQDRDDVDELSVRVLSTVFCYSYWVVSCILGGIAGSLISNFNTTGLDFVLTAVFVVITIEQLKSAKSRMPFVIAALSSVVCIVVIGPANFLLPSLIITVVALLVLQGPINKQLEKEA